MIKIFNFVIPIVAVVLVFVIWCVVFFYAGKRWGRHLAHVEEYMKGYDDGVEDVKKMVKQIYGTQDDVLK